MKLIFFPLTLLTEVQEGEHLPSPPDGFGTDKIKQLLFNGVH